MISISLGIHLEAPLTESVNVSDIRIQSKFMQWKSQIHSRSPCSRRPFCIESFSFFFLIFRHIFKFFWFWQGGSDPPGFGWGGEAPPVRFDRFDIPFDSIGIASVGRGGPPWELIKWLMILDDRMIPDNSYES